MRRGAILVLLCVSLAASVQSSAIGGRVALQGRSAGRRAAIVTITNGRMVAELGDRGLVALTDRTLGQTVRFPADDFGVTIDGRAFDSRTLPAPARTAAKDRVTYVWTAGSYRVSVVYEAAPGWRFVSKQITVGAAGASGASGAGEASKVGGFHVDRVDVFRAAVGSPVAGAFVPKSVRPNLGTGDYGACLRFDTASGLLAVVQNPFLEVARDGQAFSIGYAPDMDWPAAAGTFVADRGLLALTKLTGRQLPAAMLPEWRMGPNDSPPGMDEAEVEAFTDMVRAFLLVKAEKPVNVLVSWCLNDYQIDVGTAEGREEYRRIFDQAAALGADYVLYAPSNSELSRREESVDDWSWEHVLWLNLGQKIRKNEWDPRTSPVPASVQEMLDYARSRDLKLLAYVYPVLPFSQNPAWLVSPKNRPNRQYASLGVRALQDWLIEELVAFHDRLDLGGFAFDHTFLTYDGTSRYAQWAGWRRVMEELRRRIPDIVIDGRQAYHLYGPWSWLAGSYPHPTFNDEQPESFVPFPDLHFDRVSADRERYTAYRYKNYEFAPSEIVPGFITHQTSRSDESGDMPSRKTERGVMLEPIRQRDWDFIGWRYSLLSSIAIAGWNNVLDMIPARDPAEYAAFPEADRAWFRRWIDWTNTNKEYLRHTRTILGQPALGKVDGTSAIIGDRGYIFLFNPNGRRLTAELSLDAAMGLSGEGPFVLRELYPVENRLIGKTGLHSSGVGFWSLGDRVAIPMSGGSALVLQIDPAPATITAPMLFNVVGDAQLEGETLSLTGLRGEVGSSEEAVLVWPSDRRVAAVEAGGRREVVVEGPVSGDRPALLRGARLPIQFDGQPFDRSLWPYDPGVTGGSITGEFSVPGWVFDQLAARQKAWPIPWTAEDFRTTWLAPERLLLFVQVAEPDDRWEAQLKIDGRTVELRKAYSAIRVARRTFVGFYADLSLIRPDWKHTFRLDLPPLRPGQLQGVFFENVEPEYTTQLRQGAPARAPGRPAEPPSPGIRRNGSLHMPGTEM